MKKLPKKIPWSMVENIDLQSIVSNAVEEEFAKQRRYEYAKRPYVDLSERKEKLKDHTKVFKDIYKKIKPDLMSKNQATKDTAYLKLAESFKEYSGRPHTAKELKQIILQCEIKRPRMKMNAFGGLYTTKVINPLEDVEIK